MSTRGVIAVRKGDGFSGVYHHWDSEPEGLGITLHYLYRTRFGADLAAMRKALIDDHPAGWSSIVDKDECYCHSQHPEQAQEINDGNASAVGCEYAYLLEDEGLVILASYTGGDQKMIGMFGQGDPNATWKRLAVIRWEDEWNVW